MKTAVIASIIIFACGIYGLINSSELRWLSMPFMASPQQPGGMKGNGEGPGKGEHGNGMMRCEKPDNDMMQGERPDDGENGEKSDSDISNGGSDGKFDKGNFEGRENVKGFEGKGKNMQSSSIVQKIQTVIMFLGMILSFSMITYWIVVFKKKKQSMIQSNNQDDKE